MSGAKDCGRGRLKQIARAHFERAGPRRGAGPELEAGVRGEKALDLGDRGFCFCFCFSARNTAQTFKRWEVVYHFYWCV